MALYAMRLFIYFFMGLIGHVLMKNECITPIPKKITNFETLLLDLMEKKWAEG